MIQIGQGALSLNDFAELVFKHKEAALDVVALKKVNTSFEFLKKFSSNKLIYGINTGFGPMAQYKVSEENILQLQYNLIRSHSSGSGKLIPAQLSKALMVARLNSFMLGYSEYIRIRLSC
jgi:histidine ammonia-lyase